jgi:hypothetical protein
VRTNHLHRLPGRRLVAVPTPEATPTGWLLVGISRELGPVELLTEARAMLVPLDALLHPEAHQPDATRLHRLLTADPTSSRPDVRFLVDATRALEAVGSSWEAAGIEWFLVLFELVGLVEAGLVDALVLHDAPEVAEWLGDELPLPVSDDPGLDPTVQEQVRALLAAEVATYLAD